MRNRCWLLVMCMVCTIVLVWPGTSFAQEVRVLHMSAFAPDALTTLAQANGSLAAAGLDVQTTIAPSSTEQMQGLSDGTYDIAATAFDNVLAWSGRTGGATIVSIAQTDSGTLLPIAVRPEISDWSDLRGKPLGVDAVDTAFAVVLRRVLRAHGLELNTDYTFVPFGGPAARLAAMQDGRAYGAILNPPFDAMGVAAGMRAFGNQTEVLPDYPGGVLAVRADWAEANRQDLDAFLRAWL